MENIIQNNITFFQEKILEWYRNNGREFPWRANDITSYELVIAEILLQRTRAETVADRFSQFTNTFPSWGKINETSREKLESALKPFGLYRQKAKRLKALSNFMVNSGEQLPSNREKLEEIPLIGQYIASAILVYIKDKKAPLLDVNMARVLERYFEPRVKADIRYDEKLQGYAHSIIDHPSCKLINWAVLDLGSTICTKNNPSCERCPLSQQCNYYQVNS